MVNNSRIRYDIIYHAQVLYKQFQWANQWFTAAWDDEPWYACTWGWNMVWATIQPINSREWSAWGSNSRPQAEQSIAQSPKLVVALNHEILIDPLVIGSIPSLLSLSVKCKCMCILYRFYTAKWRINPGEYWIDSGCISHLHWTKKSRMNSSCTHLHWQRTRIKNSSKNALNGIFLGNFGCFDLCIVMSLALDDGA